MASKSTHPFKTLPTLTLYLEIFTRTTPTTPITSKTPVILFLHGGGFVAFNREHVPPHVVQASLSRGWPLISADYRLLPQASGKDALEDVRDAYDFVRSKGLGILSGEEGVIENVIVVGQSAGAWFTYYSLFFSPPPPAILTYYGVFTPLPDSDKRTTTPAPMPTSPELETFLSEPVTTNMTPDFNIFNPNCLLPDLSRNPDFKFLEQNLDNPADNRIMVLRWLTQEGKLKELFADVELGTEDPRWSEAAAGKRVVLIHGSEDESVNVKQSIELVDVFGPEQAKLFLAEGKGHCFDQFLFLGDKGLEEVEKGWDELERFVKERLR